MASPGLLAFIVTSKYADGMPLYRQEGILQRIGCDIPRATLSSWVIRCGELVTPIIKLLLQKILAGPLVQCDESPIQVLKVPGKKPTSKSFMWIIAGWDDGGRKIVLYEFSPTRSSEVPLRIFKVYKGYVQTDGYEGYSQLALKGAVRFNADTRGDNVKLSVQDDCNLVIYNSNGKALWFSDKLGLGCSEASDRSADAQLDAAVRLVCNRPATEPELQALSWQRAGGRSIREIIVGLTSVPEAQAARPLLSPSQPMANRVRALYEMLLRRQAADQEVTFWVNSGRAFDDIARGILGSAEFDPAPYRTQTNVCSWGVTPDRDFGPTLSVCLRFTAANALIDPGIYTL